MKYKGLNELRDKYPENIAVENSYTADNDSIKFTGKYPKNFIKFINVPLDDLKLGTLKTNPTISFRFIIRFYIDEQKTKFEDWISSALLRDLYKAVQQNQPFFNRNNVTIAEIDFFKLSRYWNLPKFKIPEEYAEVSVVNTINDKESVIKHINWIVSSDDKLRPVSTFGGWLVETTSKLGFDHSEELKNLDLNKVSSDLVLGNPKTATPEPTAITSVKNSNDASVSISSNIIKFKSILRTYFPFDSGGTYVDEVRQVDTTGNLYKWTGKKWVLLEQAN